VSVTVVPSSEQTGRVMGILREGETNSGPGHPSHGVPTLSRRGHTAWTCDGAEAAVSWEEEAQRDD